MKTRWRVDKIPVLQDNFVFIIYNQSQALVIDPGESGPVLDFLSKHKLHCERLLITHHHPDHIAGIADLKKKYHCPVFAPLKNKAQIPEATHWVSEKEGFLIEDLEIHTWEVPGHTLGHVAYWLPQQKWLFSGDVVFAVGCGRLFEGTAEQMFETLQRIKGLPDETLIFCTHDYFPANQAFCLAEGFPLGGYDPIHPLLLGQEKEFNPFLLAADVQTFAERRQKRNLFKSSF